MKLRAVAAILAMVSTSAPIGADQVPKLRPVMHQKLEHAKALMIAVVLGDWKEIDRESQALLALTRDPAWVVLISPTYDAQSDLFVTQLRELINGSQQRNLEATAMAEGVLIFSCARCHQSLKVLRGQQKSR